MTIWYALRNTEGDLFNYNYDAFSSTAATILSDKHDFADIVNVDEVTPVLVAPTPAELWAKLWIPFRSDDPETWPKEGGEYGDYIITLDSGVRGHDDWNDVSHDWCRYDRLHVAAYCRVIPYAPSEGADKGGADEVTP